MKRDMFPNKSSSLLVSIEILKSANISIEELQNHIIELKAILGSKLDLFVPTRITDITTIWMIIDLSHSFKKLKHCDGFDRHISTYTKNHVQSSYFVTLIASYLVDKVNSIALEPPAIGTNRSPDILVDFRGEQVFLEGLKINGKIVLVYSREGLNDTAHTEGCCCCGGNEITNAMQINVNIFVYALLK